MKPFVILFGHRLPSYGLAAVAGFLLGLTFVLLEGRRYKTVWRDAADAYLIGILGTLLGAKLLYLLVQLPSIIRDIPKIREDGTYFFTHYLAGGMVFYGGLFGAVFFAYLTTRFFGKRLSELSPMLVPALALVAGTGRIGCFLAGCCYGRETDGPVYVVFHNSLSAPPDVHLIPTQLFEAVFDYSLFFLLWYLGRKGYKEALLPLYFFLYAVFRFVLEFFRGDAQRGMALGLSTSQWISLGILLFLLIRCLYKRRRLTQTT